MNSPAPVDLLCINTLRTLAIDAVQKADSGHPGLPLGAAPMAYALWQNHLKHNPADPSWPDRDRFVLSAGHGSMLLYALLHVTGYPMTMDDLLNFRFHCRNRGCWSCDRDLKFCILAISCRLKICLMTKTTQTNFKIIYIFKTVEKSGE